MEDLPTDSISSSEPKAPVQTKVGDSIGPHLSKTPLPKLQLFILFYVQLAEPIASTVIYPFVNQLVRETGITNGDERKTGYYAGEHEGGLHDKHPMCHFSSLSGHPALQASL